MAVIHAFCDFDVKNVYYFRHFFSKNMTFLAKTVLHVHSEE